MITSPKSGQMRTGSDRIAEKLSELSTDRQREGNIDFFTVAIVLGGLLILSLLAVLFYLMAEPHSYDSGVREYYSSSAPPSIPAWAPSSK